MDLEEFETINEIKAGLRSISLFRNPFKWLAFQKYRREHKKLHNNNLFYTASPMLLGAIIKAFNLQLEKKKKGENLLDGHAYWEFGVFKGFSLWFAQLYARCNNISNFYFYGFDSFRGLPTSKIDSTNPAFREGHYAANYDFVINKLKENEVDFNKVKLFKGFYSQELFRKFKKENEFLPISIFVNDVDIYESCIEVLEFARNYLQPGSIMLFDDYNMFLKSDKHGERRALKEFEEKYPNFKKKHLFNFGWHGTAFEVIDI